MNQDYKYRAFISYSHKDKKFAKWLHKKIENYKIPKSLREKYPNLPKDLKRSVFRDEEELPTGSVLSDNLVYAIDNSELLIVVCSPSSVNSQWVDREIAHFKQKHGEDSVLAIIKSGEPNDTYNNNAKNEAFPKSLRYEVDKDGKLTDKRTEPIAGDARSYWDKDMAFVKMIAGILKVDFADLWEREKREKRKRKMITGVIASVFIALFFYASVQFVGNNVNIELEKVNDNIAKIEYSIRHDNLPVRKVIALKKKLKKLKKLKKAKEDTQKSLGQLKTPLGEKAKEVYKEKGAKAAIDILTSRDALSRKEQVRKELSLEDISLAKLYVETGKFEKAEQSYENAIGIFFDIHYAESYSAFLVNQHKNQKCIEFLQKILKEKLTKAQRCDVLGGLGIEYSIMKQQQKSEDYFKKAFILSKTFVESNSSKYNDNDLIEGLTVLAELYESTNQLTKAEKIYNKVLALTKENLSSDNNHSLASALEGLGRLYQKAGKLTKAEDAYSKSLNVYRFLVKLDPGKYNIDLQIILSDLGDLYLKAGKLKKAEDAYSEYLDRVVAMIKKTPNLHNQQLINTQKAIALSYYQTNHLEEGIDFYNKELLKRRTLMKKPLEYTMIV